jgi:deoxyribonuclease V
MILILDGDYKDNSCFMVGTLIKDFSDSEILGFVCAEVDKVGEYESGEFYKRELKGICAVLSNLNIYPGTLSSSIDCIVIDGYATFGDENHLALGEHIYKKYNMPIIGIAKNKNILCKLENTEVYRGISKNPLYVTSFGCSNEIAKKCVREMAGEHRIPDIIKLTDSLARKKQVILN